MQREQLLRRDTHMEGTGRVLQFHLQPIRLQAQEHEQSDATVALDTRRNPITFHRDLPDVADIKIVTVKREPTAKWYGIVDVETPDNPAQKPKNLPC